MGGMPMPPQQQNAGQAQNVMQRYLMQAQRILPAVQENNPHVQEQVG